MASSNAFDGARQAFENLSEREKRLVGLLGVIFVGLLIVLPLYMTSAAIGDLERSNAGIGEVLDEIARTRPQLAKAKAEREAAMSRYERPMRPLGGYVEELARNAGLAVGNVQPEPDQVVNGFTRHQVRVTLTNVGMRGVVDMMAAVERSELPVAIDQLQVEHFGAGDRYNIKLGVVGFERPRGGASATKNAGNGREATR